MQLPTHPDGLPATPSSASVALPVPCTNVFTIGIPYWHDARPRDVHLMLPSGPLVFSDARATTEAALPGNGPHIYSTAATTATAAVQQHSLSSRTQTRTTVCTALDAQHGTSMSRSSPGDDASGALTVSERASVVERPISGGRGSVPASVRDAALPPAVVLHDAKGSLPPLDVLSPTALIMRQRPTVPTSYTSHPAGVSALQAAPLQDAHAGHAPPDEQQPGARLLVLMDRYAAVHAALRTAGVVAAHHDVGDAFYECLDGWACVLEHYNYLSDPPPWPECEQLTRPPMRAPSAHAAAGGWPASGRVRPSSTDAVEACALASLGAVLPYDMGLCLGLANGLVHQIALMKSVPPPPLEVVYASNEYYARHHVRSAAFCVWGDCACGCMRGFALVSSDAYVLHNALYRRSHPHADLTADYDGWHARMMQRARALGSWEAACAATPSLPGLAADGVACVSDGSAAADRCAQLPILAVQLLSSFQDTVVDGLPATLDASTLEAPRAEDTTLTPVQRRALYARALSVRQRCLVIFACVLLSWKLLDPYVSVSALLGPVRPVLTPDEEQRYHTFGRLRRLWRIDKDPALLEELKAMELRVLRHLSAPALRGPLWLSVALESMGSYFTSPEAAVADAAAAATGAEHADEYPATRSTAYTAALHRFVSLAECVLGESSCASGPAAAAATARQTTPLATDDLPCTEAWARWAAAAHSRLRAHLCANPLFGVALAVRAGVPLPWARANLLSIPATATPTHAAADADAPMARVHALLSSALHHTIGDTMALTKSHSEDNDCCAYELQLVEAGRSRHARRPAQTPPAVPTATNPLVPAPREGTE